MNNKNKMNGPCFRTRIDFKKPLPVYRNKNISDFLENNTKTRNLSQMPSGMDKNEEV